jgi:hypothetical protein
MNWCNASGQSTKAGQGSPWSSTPVRTQEDNLELIDSGPLHFIGSLPPSDHLDLMAVPKSRYKNVDAKRFPGLSALRPPRSSSANNRIVVTHSQNFHDEQAASFEQTLAKARRQLSELAARLARGKGRKSPSRSKPRSRGSCGPGG